MDKKNLRISALTVLDYEPRLNPEASEPSAAGGRRSEVKMAQRSKRSEEKRKPEACFRDTARAPSVQIRPLHPKKPNDLDDSLDRLVFLLTIYLYYNF